MRSSSLLMVIIINAFVTESIAEPGRWSRIVAAPQPLMGLHAEAVGEKIYTFGGVDSRIASIRREPTDRVAVLDVNDGVWSYVAPMPANRGFLGTAVVDGRIYVIGGSPNMKEYDATTNVVEVYDPVADQWSFAPPLSVARADLTASVVDGRIYAIGGTAHVGVDALGVVEMYDPATGVWTRRADMPTPRLHLTSVAFEGEIFVFGGGPEWSVPLATVEIYNPDNDSWREGADMPTARTGLWAAVVDSKIYVAGGLSWENEALSTVDVYDPRTDHWESIDNMPTSRFLMAVAATGGKLYVIGGAQTDYTSLDVVEVYEP